MSLSTSRKRFDALRVQVLAASEAMRAERIAQSVKYGSEQNARSFASRGEKSRLAKLTKRYSRLGDAVITIIVRESPRAEKWLSGVPTHYLHEKLTWEDVIRPENEPLSVVPPTSFGWSLVEVRQHLGT